MELNCTNFGDRCSENETCKDVDGDIQCLCPDNFMRDENGVCSGTYLTLFTCLHVYVYLHVNLLT